jgi:hypothetical protein
MERRLFPVAEKDITQKMDALRIPSEEREKYEAKL